MTQTEAVLTLLSNGEKLTAQYVNSKYGITRLASRICDVKKLGAKIAKKQIKVRSRYGDGYTYVTEYSLIREEGDAHDEQRRDTALL